MLVGHVTVNFDAISIFIETSWRRGGHNGSPAGVLSGLMSAHVLCLCDEEADDGRWPKRA